MDSDTYNTAPKRILIVAEHRVGQGSGHLHRCARIVPGLSGKVDWLLPSSPPEGSYSRSEALRIIGNPDLPVRWLDSPAGPYDLIILDRREASLAELQSLGPAALTIGIDIAGEARNHCSYLIDALETPPGTQHPNIADSGLLHLPDSIRESWPVEVNRILVTFGGEQSGAGSDFAASLAAFFPEQERSVFLAAREQVPAPPNVTVVTSAGELSKELHNFDLIITHYGLTAYEALWARVPVLLLNPTRYHSILSRQAGFEEIHSVGDVLNGLARIGAVVERCTQIRPKGRTEIAALIDELSLPERSDSPGGGEPSQLAVERFAERTFFRNALDGLVFMQNYRGGSVQYDHDYFFTEYAKQYGKTYLEDFPAIEALGRRRIGDILRVIRIANPLRPKKSPRLLDIGCAYGPFLHAAAQAGFQVQGVDISREATRYVEEQLGFPAICMDVAAPGVLSLGGPFDVVTMWYVIEHFVHLDRVLGRIAAALSPGGLFAFSTPNGAGISARQDQREFFRRSPSDHFTVMTPQTARALLQRFGFRLRSIRITGHHPERFLFVPSGKKGVRYRIAAIISRVFRLGDTFEVVAEYLG